MEHNISSTFGDNPLSIFQNWMSEAEKSEPSDPNAMALATIGTDGKPSVRMVLLKGFGEDGFTFFTNSESGKGTALDKNPVAELNFYWKTTRKQIRIAGTVEKISASESDAYFATRPRGSQIGAWASSQSRPVVSYEAFQTKVDEIEKKFEGQDIPRPPYWNGYRLTPDHFEFWIADINRQHQRVVFELKNGQKKDVWAASWLYP